MRHADAPKCSRWPLHALKLPMVFPTHGDHLYRLLGHYHSHTTLHRLDLFFEGRDLTEVEEDGHHRGDHLDGSFDLLHPLAHTGSYRWLELNTVHRTFRFSLALNYTLLLLGSVSCE